MSERPTFADAREVAAAVIAPFVHEEVVDAVEIVSTRFHSAGTQRVEVRQLLPLTDPRDPEQREHAAHPGGPATDPAEGPREGYTEFEPDASILLADLAPRAAESEIFAALLDASASELTARQRAMAAATENAGDLITKYLRGS